MKKVIGILALIIALAGSSLLIISLWNIYPISWILVAKISITAFIVGILALMLYLIFNIFFKKEVYNKNKGNKAHPIG